MTTPPLTDHDLIVRLDERMRELKDSDIPDIKSRLAGIYGKMDEHDMRLSRQSQQVAVLEAQCNERHKLPSQWKRVAPMGAGGIVVIIYIIGCLLEWWPAMPGLP